MINFLKNLQTLIHFKKNEKSFKRIIFNENINTIKYLRAIIENDKPETCLVSLKKLNGIYFKNIKFYYFDNNFIVFILFLFLKVKYLYASTPDLNNSIFRKSIFNKTKYIYIQHSPSSLCMIYKHDAFINFDCIQVVNKNQYSDVLDINQFYNKKIKPFKSKYFFLNNLQKNKKNKINEKIDYLIAPTWNSNFYKLNLHILIFDILKELNKKFIFRPHYMSIRKNEFFLKDLNIENNEIDLSPNFDFDIYKNLITDWSGIYLEFLIIKKKKPIVINSKIKVRNNGYKKFSLKPIELELRDSLTTQFNINELDKLKKYIIKNNDDINISDTEFSNIIGSKFYKI